MYSMLTIVDCLQSYHFCCSVLFPLKKIRSGFWEVGLWAGGAVKTQDKENPSGSDNTVLHYYGSDHMNLYMY